MKITVLPDRYGVTPAATGFATLLTGIGLGRFGYPPLIPALVKAGWFTVAQADYLGAANLTGYVLGAAVAARVNQWIPAVRLIRLALLTVLGSFMLCAAPLPFGLYFAMRFMAGTAGGVLMVLTAATIFRHTAPARKGLTGGIVFSGVGVGIALGGTLIPMLVARSIALTWMVFALASFLLVMLTWKGWPAGSNELHALEPKPTGGRHHAWSRAVVLLLVSYSCNAIGFVPHTVFWVDFISRGLRRGLAAGTQMWVLLGIAAAAGPLLSGYMADRIGFGKSIRVSLLVKATGVLLPVISTAWWSLALSSVFVGSFALGISSLTAGRVTELVPPGLQKQVWGWMTFVFSIMHAGTAYLLSYIFSITGSYQLLFEIGAVTLLVGCMLDFLGAGSKADRVLPCA